MGHVTLLIEAPQVSCHPATFGGHRSCGKGDIMVLVGDVISQKTARLNDHVTLWVRQSHGKYLPCQVLCPQELC